MKKSQQKLNKVSKIAGLGYLENLNFCLELNDYDVTQNQIDYTSINTLQDLDPLLKNNEELIEKISITTTSTTVNKLLYLCKTCKTKSFVEFTSFNWIQLNENEEFFQTIITRVTENNFLFLAPTKISNLQPDIKFTIKLNGKVIRDFKVGLKNNQNENQEKKDENELNETNKNKENSDELNDDIKNKEESQEKKKKNEFIENLNFVKNNFDYLYFDLNTIIAMSNTIDMNVTLSDILWLFDYITKYNDKMKIIVNFPSIINNINSINLDNLNLMHMLMSFIDIFIFERKDSIEYLNLIHQLNNQDFKEVKGKISDQQLEKLFINSFETKRSKNQKLAIFLDDFVRCTIISKQGNLITNNCYPLDLYPKVNHTNQKLIEEYKKHILVNKAMLKSVFYGGFFSKFFSSNNILGSLNVSIEITKRILELYKLDLDFPLHADFYIVNLKKNSKNDIAQKQKEDKFVLDCVNLNRSKLETYNPLCDNNLFSFFSSNVIRKHLKQVGFINTKGFILDDPSKITPNTALKDKSAYEIELEKEKKLLIAVVENERRDKEIKKKLYQRSKYLHDYSVKELEKMVKINDFNRKSNPVLPSFVISSSKLKPIKGYSSIGRNTSNEKVNIF